MLAARTVLALLALAALAPVAAGGTQSWNYAISSSGYASFMCAPCFDKDLNVGGVRFEHPGQQPIRVDVVDRTGGPVNFAACQDLDADDSCGEAGEPFAEECGTTLALPATFRSDRETLVYVHLWNFGCDGVGTTGRVTLTTAP